jgi:hypothetical protein
MRILYIEPYSGISGDMFVAALLELGGDLPYLRRQLALLPLERYELSLRKCSRAGIQATKFDVTVGAHDSHSHSHQDSHAGHTHRSFQDIRQMILGSALSSWVREKSVEAFERLAEAEGKIHDRPAAQVEFHEVGAVDSIVDIVGTMIALERLLPARLISAPVNLGWGTVECQHGIYPVPGPATQVLLTGAPTYSDSTAGELTTPTGAVLLATLIEGYGPRPLMNIKATGYGAGGRDIRGRANVLRITLGEEVADLPAVFSAEQVAVIETTIDDMNPQIYGYLQERVLREGALDLYLTPIQMKKNRPGVKLTVVCPPEKLDLLARTVFEETTTIGLRFTLAQRKTLRREFTQVQTEYGQVTIKVSSLDGRQVNYVPEYEDCRRLASEKGVALREVQAAAVRAFLVKAP